MRRSIILELILWLVTTMFVITYITFGINGIEQDARFKYNEAHDNNLSITCNDFTTKRRVIPSSKYTIYGNFIEYDGVIYHVYKMSDCEVNY